jgi:glycosyltransferase involved in cell wall biosynthesis
VNSGSVGRIAEQIGQTVIEQGWESYITYARNHLPSKSKTIKIGNKFDVYWHGINTRLFDNHCLCSTNAAKRLIKQIDEIKPDIIQLHNLHGYYLNIRILFEYLQSASIPAVWTLHDCWTFTGHCTHFDYIGCEKWITGCYECPQKGEYPASKLLDRSQRNYELKKRLFTSVKNMTIVPVSYWLGEQVNKSFLNKYPVQVIQNGIDTDLFSPKSDLEAIKKKYNIQGKFVILGVASIWDDRKGLKDFILLNNLIDHEKNVILLVGLNKNQKRKMPKNIFGIERTESINELVELYSVADVHITCSVEETFGLTLVESMACGTPVIGYNATAIPELIDNGSTGFFLEKNNIEGLYEAIQKIKEKGKCFFTENCRKKAVSLYDRRERYKDYLNLYNQLLNRL